MDISNSTPENWIENESVLLKQLENDLVWNSIPLLNTNELYNLKDSSLVRFQGMIQDMHSPEYYMEKVEVIHDTDNTITYRSGKYCDGVDTSENETLNFESGSNITAERHTYVVTSIPGINNWAQVIAESKFKINQNMCVNVNSSNKRTFDEVMVSENSMETADHLDTNTDAQKKVCNLINEVNLEHSQNIQPLLSKESLLNFPLPCQNGKTCHLKVYQNQEDLKLNEMCEFVGFLSNDPVIEAAYQDNDESESRMEQEIRHPPSSLIPKIHCVSFKKLKHNNPLLLSVRDHLQNDKFEVLHKEMLIVFTQLLLGDDLAAEYLLLSLLSEVYLRREILPLGKFCLNISNVPMLDNLDYVYELYKFIELLVSKSFYLPMTLENMNNLSFIPKKDYECNRLTSGILQLSQNTHFVLDETKLTAGKLNSSGIDAVKALIEVIEHQKLTYDFAFYQLPFDCDIPFIIFSEGKSMLGSDVHVVLKPEQTSIDTFAEIIDAAKHFLKPELMNDIRKYLTQARLIQYEIADNVENLVQEEFIKMRQNGNVLADDLHNLLVLARLITLSKGKTRLDEDCWRKACDLERNRKARIVK